MMSSRLGLGSMLGGPPAEQPQGYPAPWDLPDVSDSELDLVKPSSGGRKSSSASRGSKKPSSSPKKMPRREAEDEDASTDDGDYMMTGGLH